MQQPEVTPYIRPLIDGWPGPVFITDCAGTILIANKAVRNLGFPNTRFAGCAIDALIDLECIAMQEQLRRWSRETAATPMFARLKVGEQCDTQYLAYGHAIGLDHTTRRGIQIRLTRLDQALGHFQVLNNKVEHLSKRLHTEQVQSTVRRREFCEMQRTLEERTRLLAATSHELRTPLNAIIGFSEMIRDGYVSGEKQREYANDIYNSGHLLLSLVNDLLNYSATLAAAAEPQLTTVSVSSLLDMVEKTVHGFVLKFGKRLDIKFLNAPSSIQIDNRMGIQVLTNLITNAAKYSGKSSPRIGLRVRHEDGYAVFSVVDTGPGMTREELHNALKPYVQLKKSVQQEMGGVGLGLSLVQHMVEKNGGAFRLWSKRGLGTVASVKFKLVTPAPEANDNACKEGAQSEPAAAQIRRYPSVQLSS